MDVSGIDFDGASAAWNENKIRRGPSMLYRCQAIKSDGSWCKKKAVEKIPCTNQDPYLCSSHIYTWKMNRATMKLNGQDPRAYQAK